MLTAVAFLAALVVALIVTATSLIEQRNDWRGRAERLGEDFDALVARHAEVLDEHARCPIEEPQGHLAVVEDTRGVRWVSWRDPRERLVEHKRPWQSSDMDTNEWRDFQDIDVAKVLSEGWPE